jgi:hypothetical protein
MQKKSITTEETDAFDDFDEDPDNLSEEDFSDF